MAGEKSKGLVLLDFWVSPYGQRCRIAMAEKGLPYEYLEQDLLATKSDLLLRSNPVHKKVPVLLHDGRPVCESLIILQYLDEAFPGKTQLLPSDPWPYMRAQALFWADYIDKKVYTCGTRLWQLKGEPQLQARAEMVEILKTLEAELGDRAFFGGEAFGFLDVVLVPFTAWFHSYEKSRSTGSSAWRSARGWRRGRGGAASGRASPRTCTRRRRSTTSSAPRIRFSRPTGD